jgi:hypothetical protein
MAAFFLQQASNKPARLGGGWGRLYVHMQWFYVYVIMMIMMLLKVIF